MAGGTLVKLREEESLRVVTLSVLCGTVLFLFPYWVPSLVGIFGVVSLFSPLPSIYAARRLGITRGALSVFLTAGAVALFGEPSAGFQFFFEFGMATLFLSAALHRDVSIGKAIAGASCATLLVIAAFGFAYSLQRDTGMFDGVRQWIDSTLTQVLVVLEKSSVSTDQIRAVHEKKDRIVELLLSISPSIGFAFVSMICFLNIIAADRLFRMFKGARPLQHGDLTRWRSPDKLIWVLLVSGFCLVFDIPGVTTVAWNVFLILVLSYFFQGLSIVAYFFRTRKIPVFLEVLFYFLLITQIPVMILLALAGIFDLWINFRRI